MQTKKRLLATALTFIICFAAIGLNKLPVYGVSFNEVKYLSNGSFDVTLSQYQGNVTLSNFVVNHEINGVQKGNLQLTGITYISGNTYRINYSPVAATTEKQELILTVYYKSSAVSMTGSINYTIDALSVNSMKVIESNNGSFVLDFDKEVSYTQLLDYTANLYVDGVDKGSLPLTSLSQVTGYNDRIKIEYKELALPQIAEDIKIEVSYRNISKAESLFTLYPNGAVSDGAIGAEYASYDEPSFTILNISNGEMGIRFKNPIRRILDPEDFYLKYFVDGKSQGELKVTGISEDETQLGTDFVLHFDKVSSNGTSKTVTLLSFYEVEAKTQPRKASFALSNDESVYEMDITIDEVKKFSNSVTVNNLIAKETQKNTIFPSSSSSVEYIKLELPSDFEFTSLNVDITGKNGLSGVSEYNIKYGTVNGVTAKNIILAGLTGSYSSRGSVGSLAIDNLQIQALNSAEYGDVSLKINGAGIPYERITIAEYTKDAVNINNTESSQTDSDNKSNNNSNVFSQTYTVTLIENNRQMYVNGELIEMDTRPYIKDSRLMLPVSYVALAFGIPSEDIKWDNTLRQVTILKDGKTIKMDIGSKILTIDGEAVIMDASAEISDQRTFIPMRFLADALGFTTTWNESLRMATLTNK